MVVSGGDCFTSVKNNQEHTLSPAVTKHHNHKNTSQKHHLVSGRNLPLATDEHLLPQLLNISGTSPAVGHLSLRLRKSLHFVTDSH